MKKPQTYVIRPKIRWEVVKIHKDQETVMAVWGSEEKAMKQLKKELRKDEEGA